MSLETQENQTFWWDIPGIWRDIPGGARKVWEKSLFSSFVLYLQPSWKQWFCLGKWHCQAVSDRRFAKLGRTPKGSYSLRGRSRHPLETPLLSEPLLRTLLTTLLYCETHSRPPSENPSPEPFPEPSQNPSSNAVLPYDSLGSRLSFLLQNPRTREGFQKGCRRVSEGVSEGFLKGICWVLEGVSQGPFKTPSKRLHEPFENLQEGVELDDALGFSGLKHQFQGPGVL